MGCVIYYLYGETVPALLAEAKLKNGGAAQAIREALIVDNEIIAKFDGTTEIPNHHRELIAIAHAIRGRPAIPAVNGMRNPTPTSISTWTARTTPTSSGWTRKPSQPSRSILAGGGND